MVSMFLFLCMPHNFLLKPGHFEYYNMAALEIMFYPLPKVFVATFFVVLLPWLGGGGYCLFVCFVLLAKWSAND